MSPANCPNQMLRMRESRPLNDCPIIKAQKEKDEAKRKQEEKARIQIEAQKWLLDFMPPKNTKGLINASDIKLFIESSKRSPLDLETEVITLRLSCGDRFVSNDKSILGTLIDGMSINDFLEFAGHNGRFISISYTTVKNNVKSMIF